jgi:DNA-binding NtrC family response regulator
MATVPVPTVSVLAVLPDVNDQRSLGSIFEHSAWSMRFAQTLREVRTALLDLRIGVVICESCLTDGHCWRDVLNHTVTLLIPPPVIVTDRLADDALWAEVLNLGGYDLLMKPFDRAEVYRVVSLAWLSWKDRFARRMACQKELVSGTDKRSVTKQARTGT